VGAGTNISQTRPNTNLEETKQEFLDEHKSVSTQELNCLIDTVNDENIKFYTRAEWRRKVQKVRIDEDSCREKLDTMKVEIKSLKRQLEDSKTLDKDLKPRCSAPFV
jgi:hypothetical protein